MNNPYNYLKTDMNKRTIITVLSILLVGTTYGQRTVETQVTLENKSKIEQSSYPVSVDIRDAFGDGTDVRSALVKLGGVEIPCQIDDLDGDRHPDEVFFLANLPKKSKQTYSITLSDFGSARRYEPRVYTDLMLTNKKIKESNKQDLYISQLTVDRDVNPYWMLHHHGCAFENELVAYRIYFDHRQTVDIYGKYRKGLELKATQFYPDSEQKAAGYGDDVLWVGETFGLGALRGWDGNAPTMIKDVEHRGQRIVARGPLRTIIEVYDEDWLPTGATTPVTMTTHYTLYAGRRDCRVDVGFSRDVADLKFATGIINVKNSTEFSDKQGLRGCWGTDWPVSEKDSAGHKRETVGLGICLPQEVVENELPANKNNYPYVVKVNGNHLTYHISFCSDNESFGMHSEKEWYACLQEWKKALGVKVTVKTR